jgi:CheY-like chemotaxis protein
MTSSSRILYAEDCLEDIELTLAAFKENNIHNPVDTVLDGEEVLDYLLYRNKYKTREKIVPAVVLLDIKMPGVDGIEVLKTIRKTKEYENLPIIMFTSSQMESDILKSYEFGANGYVVKPIDFTDFVLAIRSIGYFWAILNTSPYKI